MIYTPEIMGNAVYPKLLSDIDEIICNVLLKNIEVERAAYLLRRPDTTKPYLLYKVNNIKFIVSALPDKQYLQGILKENYNLEKILNENIQKYLSNRDLRSNLCVENDQVITLNIMKLKPDTKVQIVPKEK